MKQVKKVWNKGISPEEYKKHYKNFNWLSKRKNKTYEEIYGEEQSLKIKNKQSISASLNIQKGVKNAFSKGIKHSKYWLGKHHTTETIAKIKKNRYNPMLYSENRKKISLALKGKTPKNLELINKNKNGSGNPMWQGGASLRGYSKDWTRKLRHLIRLRDNFLCILCGKHQEKEKKSLCVHHINYDKTLNIKENLISLCSDCHHKTNINRVYWTTFFHNLLNEKYGYSYSNGEIIFKIAEQLEKQEKLK